MNLVYQSALHTVAEDDGGTVLTNIQIPGRLSVSNIIRPQTFHKGTGVDIAEAWWPADQTYITYHRSATVELHDIGK